MGAWIRDALQTLLAILLSAFGAACTSSPATCASLLALPDASRHIALDCDEDYFLDVLPQQSSSSNVPGTVLRALHLATTLPPDSFVLVLSHGARFEPQLQRSLGRALLGCDDVPLEPLLHVLRSVLPAHLHILHLPTATAGAAFPAAGAPPPTVKLPALCFHGGCWTFGWLLPATGLEPCESWTSPAIERTTSALVPAEQSVPIASYTPNPPLGPTRMLSFRFSMLFAASCRSVQLCWRQRCTQPAWSCLPCALLRTWLSCSLHLVRPLFQMA
eukprot:s2437_g8.t1